MRSREVIRQNKSAHEEIEIKPDDDYDYDDYVPMGMDVGMEKRSPLQPATHTCSQISDKDAVFGSIKFNVV